MMRYSAVLLIAGCATTLALAANAPKLRLSEVETIKPLSYKVQLNLDPEKDDFTGTIEMKLDVGVATAVIWLNQEKLTVKTVSLTAGGKTVTGKAIPGGDDFVGLQFDQPVAKGAATLKVSYAGVVEKKNSAGIFRQQDNGNWYIFSQFEPTDARAAFPCFDEPSYKTPWQLTITIPKQDTAVSNTGIVATESAGAETKVTFRETLPLPSYLVAFGVGPFEYVPAGKAGQKQVPVRIVVPKGHAAEAKYAAEITAEIISTHEKYFGMPFPYDKSDQVAIPDTAGFGAMENPGMVTYAQNLLLAKPDRDSINRQRAYAVTAAHELAHQWFGDLVTTAWWNDIWLNEAFATWMEQKFVTQWKPEWKTDVETVGAKLFAEGQDSLITARKIRQPIEAKDDINNAFDGITYQKGAAVIGMFESWIGAANFRKGVQSYMKQYAFRATTAGDFLDSISTASGKEVTKSFSTFLNQSGVPLVSVALRCDQGGPTLHLEQERYLPLGSKGSADQTWSIPVCVRYGSGDSGESECTLLTDKTSDWKLKTQSCPTWVQANDRAVGYYRVNYQGRLFAALTSGDTNNRLSAPERVDVMGNARSLSAAGKLSGGELLTLAETFHADPERQVVESALDIAVTPTAYLVTDNLRPNYQRFLRKNFDERARKLGWETAKGEADEVKLLRPPLLRAVATSGADTQLAEQARVLMEKWLKDHSAIDPNLVGSVLGTAAYYGDKALFERFLDEFSKTQDRQVRRALIGAMGSFRDPVAIRTGMQALIDGKVPFIEGSFLLFNGQESAVTRKLPLEFAQAHWDQIVAKMPTGGGFDFGSVLPQVGASFCDAESKQELSDFFKPRVAKFVGASRSLDQVLEKIDLCIATTAAQRPSVEAFLAKY